MVDAEVFCPDTMREGGRSCLEGERGRFRSQAWNRDLGPAFIKESFMRISWSLLPAALLALAGCGQAPTTVGQSDEASGLTPTRAAADAEAPDRTVAAGPMMGDQPQQAQPSQQAQPPRIARGRRSMPPATTFMGASPQATPEWIQAQKWRYYWSTPEGASDYWLRLSQTGIYGQGGGTSSPRSNLAYWMLHPTGSQLQIPTGEPPNLRPPYRRQPNYGGGIGGRELPPDPRPSTW